MIYRNCMNHASDTTPSNISIINCTPRISESKQQVLTYVHHHNTSAAVVADLPIIPNTFKEFQRFFKSILSGIFS